MKKFLIENNCNLILNFWNENNVFEQFKAYENLIVFVPNDQAIREIQDQYFLNQEYMFSSSIFKDILFNHFGFYEGNKLFVAINDNQFKFTRDHIDTINLKTSYFDKELQAKFYIIDRLLITENQESELIESTNKTIKGTIVRGPYALEKLISTIDDRIIYIFYDSHFKPKSCSDDSISIVDFIKELLGTERDYDIDFMLEVNLDDMISLNQNSHLQELRFMLKDCYGLNKSKCKFPNTRIHRADIRLQGILKEYMEILDMVNQTNQIPMQVLKSNGLDMIELHKKFFHLIRSINARFSIDKILFESKILKQIDNISDKTIRITLLTEIKNQIRWSYEKFLQLLDRRNQIYVDYKILKALLEFTSFFMDAYAISRMLRNFRNTTMKNIVVYTGAAHSSNISFLLSKIGYKVEKVIGKENFDVHKNELIDDHFQCLDITDFLPFFQ